MYRGRLAPAPTGALHLGNARTFLIAWLRARRAGGEILLRIEDLDHPRVKPETAANLLRDLEWLGLDWDGEVLTQSARHAEYDAVLQTLAARGLVYPCVCTRKDLESVQSAPNAGEDLHETRYPGTCRDRFASFEEAAAVAHGRAPGLRFRVAPGARFPFVDGFAGARDGALDNWSGDFLIARGGGDAAVGKYSAGYQLAVVVDDHATGVTEVVRGDDLLASTERQLALYAALGWPPPQFFHVPLVTGEDGRRLAKRHGDTRLSVLRERGDSPERVLGWIAKSCGWAERLTEKTLAEISGICDFSLLPHSPVVLGGADKEWMGF